MRLNNRSKAKYYSFLSTLVLLILLFGFIFFFLEYWVYNYLGVSQYLLLFIPISFVILFYVRGRQIFEYDSDGETLNFKNRNVISFLNKSLSDEFPKYKLISYEIINAILFKRLYITISSKKSNSLILKYDISYLTKKELNDLIASLSKVIRKNKEQEREKIS